MRTARSRHDASQFIDFIDSVCKSAQANMMWSSWVKSTGFLLIFFKRFFLLFCSAQGRSEKGLSLLTKVILRFVANKAFKHRSQRDHRFPIMTCINCGHSVRCDLYNASLAGQVRAGTFAELE